MTEKIDAIPDDEILRDVVDTTMEIRVMEIEARAFEQFPDRLSDMRARARRTGIAERREFIGKLRTILSDRYGTPV